MSRPYDDDDLRMLLHDAVADVEPDDALPRLRERTRRAGAATGSAQKGARWGGWLVPVGGAVAATALTVAGVSLLTGPFGPRDDVATPPEPGVTSVEPPADPVTGVPAYFLGDTPQGPRLFREFLTVEVAGDPLASRDDVVGAVARSVGAALESAPADPDYVTGWPAGTALRDVAVDDVITLDLTNPEVDLTAPPGGTSPDEAGLALQQIVRSAQAGAEQRLPVRFLVDGTATTLLGQDVTRPVRAGEDLATLAPVWIIDPGTGAEVASPFTVTGLAAAYEATVEWELLSGDRRVAEGFATAEECCTMAPYSFEVSAPPGTYTLLVRQSDPSGGEGPGPAQDTKQITVR